jgi:hypothetical protein
MFPGKQQANIGLGMSRKYQNLFCWSGYHLGLSVHRKTILRERLTFGCDADHSNTNFGPAESLEKFDLGD